MAVSIPPLAADPLADASPFVTVEDLATFLNLSEAEAQTGRLEAFVAGACAHLTVATGRVWTRQQYTEVLAGTGTKYLALRHYPITLVTEVREKGRVLVLDPWDGSAPEGAEVSLVAACSGVLTRLGGEWAAEDRATIRVVYTAGPSAPPADLKTAALELAAWALQTTGGRQSVTIQGSTATFAPLPTTPGLYDAGVRQLPMVAAAIRAHRDPVWGR